jgi:ATP-dependent RNA helicase RhlE
MTATHAGAGSAGSRGRERKRDLLRELVALGRIDQALVFTRTKHGANRLAEQLVKDGINTAAIHGNKSQSQRVKALTDFKAGNVAILVATDIAARGLDIDQLPHVVNFELPMVPEDYIHRIGRTGRAGTDGQAISLVCVDEAPLLRDIERLWAAPSRDRGRLRADRLIRPAHRLRARGDPYRPPGRGPNHPSSARPAAGTPPQRVGRHVLGACAVHEFAMLPGGASRAARSGTDERSRDSHSRGRSNHDGPCGRPLVDRTGADRGTVARGIARYARTFMSKPG